jgi:hypothetical protein
MRDQPALSQMRQPLPLLRDLRDRRGRDRAFVRSLGMRLVAMDRVRTRLPQCREQALRTHLDLSQCGCSHPLSFRLDLPYCASLHGYYPRGQSVPFRLRHFRSRVCRRLYPFPWHRRPVLTFFPTNGLPLIRVPASHCLLASQRSRSGRMDNLLSSLSYTAFGV